MRLEMDNAIRTLRPMSLTLKRTALCGLSSLALAACDKPASHVVYNSASSAGPAETTAAAGQSGDAQTAATVIQDYYRAIRAKDYLSAYRQWDGEGRASS